MSTEEYGKKLLLTRDAIRQSTQQERLLYGPLIKKMREDARLTQEEVSERSGVTTRTIRNIELCKASGQADKLISLFIALGVDLEGDLYSADMQRHLSLLASMIQRIDPEFQDQAVGEVVMSLAKSIQEHPAESLQSNVSSLEARRLIKQADALLYGENVSGVNDNSDSYDQRSVADTYDNDPDEEY